MNSKLSMITSMLIFGTIGIFVEYINMPSGVIAAVRGFVGAAIIFLFMLITRQRFDFAAIRKNLILLIASGAAIGFNWILRFEAYNKAGVPVATVCYYMAPIFVIVVSPFLLKERLSAKKVVCVAVALVGMMLVAGLFNSGTANLGGILLGLGAAALYASAIIMNKFLGELSAYEKTLIQLLVAAITVTPYAAIAGGEIDLRPVAIAMLAIVGIVHTGIAYTLYFGSMKKLKAQNVAILSYIDPASAIILSMIIAAILSKPLPAVTEIVGAVLIIGAAFVSEVSFKKKNEQN